MSDTRWFPPLARRNLVAAGGTDDGSDINDQFEYDWIHETYKKKPKTAEAGPTGLTGVPTALPTNDTIVSKLKVCTCGVQFTGGVHSDSCDDYKGQLTQAWR